MGSGLEEIAAAAHALGHTFREQGKLDQTEICYTQALALREQALGGSHPSVGETLRDLAWVCEALGRLADAEAHLRRAVAVFERAQGIDYDGDGLHVLAGLCLAQGRPAEAEPLLLRAVALKERRLGRDHFDVAMRLGDLASLYESRDRLVEARQLRERMIPILAREWGAFDLQTAAQLEHLATLCDRTGALAEAARHRRTITEIRTRATQPRN
jgi:tetratricopeptide (TPR) repeat protein